MVCVSCLKLKKCHKKRGACKSCDKVVRKLINDGFPEKICNSGGKQNCAMETCVGCRIMKYIKNDKFPEKNPNEYFHDENIKELKKWMANYILKNFKL